MDDLCEQMQKLGNGIGSATRYRLLEALMPGPKSVNQLVRVVKLSQPAVSQHLKKLKSSELVTDEKRGQEVYYALNTKYMLAMLNGLARAIAKKRKC